MADSYTIDPSEFTPTSGGTPAPVAAKPKAPVKINPADFKPASSGLEGPTELHSGVSTPEYVAEEGARLAGYGAGQYLAGPAGGALGGGAADFGIALAHHLLHGSPINVSPANVTKDFEANAVGSYAGEGAGQILGPVVKGMGRAIVDKPGIDAAATEAAQTLGEKNLAARADVAEKTGAANLQARGDVGAAVDPAKAQMDATAKAAEQKAIESTSDLANKEAQKLLPEAKTAAIQSAGSKVDSSLEQGPERIDRNEQFREGIKAPLQNWRAQWGQRRNDLLAPHMDTAVDPSPLQDSVAQQSAQWQAAGRAPFSPRVQKLLGKVAQIGPQTQNQFPDETPYMHGVLGDFTDPAKRASAEDSLIRLGEKPPTLAEPSTVRTLLGHQAEANAVAQSSKGADRTMAQSVSRGVDEALSNVAPTPELKALNAEYRDHRENFPMSFEDKINNVARPVDAAPEIFNHPQRVMDLIKLGTPETRQQLAQLYAKHVTENGPGVIDKSQAPFMGKLFPNTPYAKSEAWIYQDKAEQHLAQVIDSSPAVKAKWEAAMAEGQQKIKADFANSFVKEAFAQSKALGPMGNRLAVQMRAAKTPEQAADIAAKFFQGVTPENAAGEMAATQTSPTDAATNLAVTQASPEQAGVEAISRGYKPTSTWNRMKSRAQMWAMLAAATTPMMGHPSYYAAAGLGLATGAGAREILVKAFRNSLTDEAAARAYYKAVLSPGAPGALNVIATQAAKAGLSDLMTKGVKNETGVSLEGKSDEPPPKVTTGPGVKSVIKSTAETVAPTPSASARAEEVIGDLGKGKNPEVHQDLQRGRLSLDEINKLVRYGAKGPTQMLDHVNVTEAMDALEMASPDERKMLQPLVEQKMRQSFAGGKYNKTLASNLARRLQTLKAQV